MSAFSPVNKVTESSAVFWRKSPVCGRQGQSQVQTPCKPCCQNASLWSPGHLTFGNCVRFGRVRGIWRAKCKSEQKNSTTSSLAVFRNLQLLGFAANFPLIGGGSVWALIWAASPHGCPVLNLAPQHLAVWGVRFWLDPTLCLAAPHRWQSELFFRSIRIHCG